jgi:hypothetical protein
MQHYEVEDNIDFYAELLKDDNTLIDSAEEINSNICLLTQQPLDKTSLTLPCKHSFNYSALFNEVKIQKKDPYCNDSYDTNKAYSFGMNCPYCRTKYGYILPPCHKIPSAKANVAFVNKKAHGHMSFDIYCEYNDNEDFCNDVYITNIGKYCKKHYQEIIKQNKQLEKNASKKFNKKQNKDTGNELNAISKQQKQYIFLAEPINHDILEIFKELSVIQLRTLIKQNKLKLTGKKEDLINRLHNYYHNDINVGELMTIVKNYLVVNNI